MSEREWRFYLDDMAKFAERAVGQDKALPFLAHVLAGNASLMPAYCFI